MRIPNSPGELMWNNSVGRFPWQIWATQEMWWKVSFFHVFSRQALAPSPHPCAKRLQVTGWSPATVGSSFILVLHGGCLRWGDPNFPKWVVKNVENPWKFHRNMDDLGEDPILGNTPDMFWIGESDWTRSPEEEDDRVKLGDSICLACPALLHRSLVMSFTSVPRGTLGNLGSIQICHHFSAQGKKPSET